MRKNKIIRFYSIEGLVVFVLKVKIIKFVSVTYLPKDHWSGLNIEFTYQ